MAHEIMSVALSAYEPRSYAERPNGDFVKYGEDNLFPNYLVELYNGSSTHRALCTTIATMIYGDGFVPTDLDARLLYEKWNLEEELLKAAFDLKIQGGMAFEIQWSLDRESIANVSHIPFESIRCAEVDPDTEMVEEFYYSPDWSDRQLEPTVMPRFDSKRKIEEPVQVLFVKPFSPGSAYYPKPDYIGSLPYIELEPEIGRFHINNIRNGLMTSMAVHFANGIPPVEEQRQIKNQIQSESAGSGNAGNFWVTFSDSPDKRPAIDTFQLSDADKQYQFLSTECVDKIMIGHRVVSPAMFGVKTAGQLGTSQELDTAAGLFKDQVITPLRSVIKDALFPLYNESGVTVRYESDQIEVESALEFTGIQISSAIDVISKTKTGELDEAQAAQILQFMLGFSPEAVQQLFPTYQVQLSAQHRAPVELFDALEGEEIGDEWELIDEREVDYDQEETLDALWTFARVPSSNPNGKSKQDSDLIKTRYRYAPDVADENSRDFCSKMVKAKKVYRKEDILAASERVVNPGWGPRGADTYNLFLYKGGGSCRHFWMRQTYLKKNNKKITVTEAKRIINALPASERDGRRLPVNDPKVAQRPRDMTNRGFLDPRKFTTPR